MKAENDEAWMKMAADQAFKCIPSSTAFSVGAVLLSASGKLLSHGYSRELPGNTHAEQVCLLKLSSLSSAVGGTIYSTMEPCGDRSAGNTPCADLIIESQIAKCIVGIKEPRNFVENTRGLQRLIDSGVIVEFVEGLSDECRAPNKHLL